MDFYDAYRVRRRSCVVWGGIVVEISNRWSIINTSPLISHVLILPQPENAELQLDRMLPAASAGRPARGHVFQRMRLPLVRRLRAGIFHHLAQPDHVASDDCAKLFWRCRHHREHLRLYLVANLVTF
jgi:hypothetical protein